MPHGLLQIFLEMCVSTKTVNAFFGFALVWNPSISCWWTKQFKTNASPDKPKGKPACSIINALFQDASQMLVVSDHNTGSNRQSEPTEKAKLM